MKTTVETLKDLYVKIGGSLNDKHSSVIPGRKVSDYETISDMVSALSQIAQADEPELPEVSAQDNGKVLSVVEGEWDKADADYLTKDIPISQDDGVYFREDDTALISVESTEFDSSRKQGSIVIDTEQGSYNNKRTSLEAGHASFSINPANTDDAVVINAGDFSSYVQISCTDHVDGNKKKSLQIQTKNIIYKETANGTTSQKQWTLPNAETGRLVVSTEVPKHTYSNSLPPRSYTASDPINRGDMWHYSDGSSSRLFICTMSTALTATWHEIALTPYTGT